MYRIESPECPQKLVLGVSRRGFLLGLIIGAALCYGAMHTPVPAWLRPSGPTGELPDVPSPPPGVSGLPAGQVPTGPVPPPSVVPPLP